MNHAYSNQQEVWVSTGKTSKQVYAEVEKAEAMGKKFAQIEIDRCYVCKRRIGEEAILMSEDGKSAVVNPTIDLRLYEVRINKETISKFPLCHECFVLISGLGAEYLNLVGEGSSRHVEVSFGRENSSDVKSRDTTKSRKRGRKQNS